MSSATEESESTVVQIRKGNSASSLEPFRSVAVTNDITTLAQMRVRLTELNIMAESDSFLNKGLYLIHNDSEGRILWAKELRPDSSDDENDKGALSVLTTAPEHKPVTAADGTLRIFKGKSADDLKPFKALKIPDEVETLAQLRKTLGRSRMGMFERFLTSDSFPVKSDDEKDIKWIDILQPKAEGKDDDSGAIAILETGSKPSIPPPTLPEKHKFEPLPDGKTIVVPVVPDTPNADAYVGEPQPNAKMLSEDQAKAVFEINSLLNGVWLNHPSHPRAFWPIFQFPDGASYLDLIQLADASSIDSKTTFSEKDSTVVKQGLDSASIDISSPWVSASASWSKSTASKDGSDHSTQYITAMYRYPRAIVVLDTERLKPTDQFTADLKEAVKAENTPDVVQAKLIKFFQRYGHAFASQIELGGVLHSTQVVKVDETTDQTQNESDVRAALSAKIFMVSANASGEISHKTDTDTATAKSKSDAVVEAIGGDTLLATNPTLWPASVMPYVNWRVIKYSGLTLLTDLPNLFSPDVKARISALFPAWQNKALIGEYANRKDFLAPGFVPATGPGDGPYLCVKQHPSDPNPDPKPVFASPVSFHPLDTGDTKPKDGKKFWEPIAEKELDYFPITLVLSAEAPDDWAKPWAQCLRIDLIEIKDDKAVGFPYIEGGPNGGVGVGWWPEYIKDVKFAGRVTAKKDCVQFTAPSTTSG